MRIRRILRALILQDLFCGFSKTGHIQLYTYVKLLEEVTLASIIIVIFEMFNIMNLILILGIVHLINAMFSPPFYNALDVKKRIKGVSIKEGREHVFKIIERVSRHIDCAWITGSILHSEKHIVKDIDLSLKPKNILHAYVLLWYVRLLVILFLIGYLKVFPDVYVTDVCVYNECFLIYSKPKKVLRIALSGADGSGKTTIAKLLVKHPPIDNCKVISFYGGEVPVYRCVFGKKNILLYVRLLFDFLIRKFKKISTGDFTKIYVFFNNNNQALKLYLLLSFIDFLISRIIVRLKIFLNFVCGFRNQNILLVLDRYAMDVYIRYTTLYLLVKNSVLVNIIKKLSYIIALAELKKLDTCIYLYASPKTLLSRKKEFPIFALDLMMHAYSLIYKSIYNTKYDNIIKINTENDLIETYQIIRNNIKKVLQTVKC